MKEVTLPSGERLPAFGMGTWHIGDDPTMRVEELATLRLGLDLGARLIDTAEMYGDGRTEALVGEAIAGSRDERGSRWPGHQRDNAAHRRGPVQASLAVSNVMWSQRAVPQEILRNPTADRTPEQQATLETMNKQFDEVIKLNAGD